MKHPCTRPLGALAAAPAIFLFIAVICGPAAAGKLDDVRDEVGGDSEKSDDSGESRDSDSGSSCYDDDDYDDDDDGFVGVHHHTSPSGSFWKKSGPRKPSFRAGLEYAHDVDFVYRPGLYMLFQSSWLVGFETAWSVLLEEVPKGIDRLVMGDTNVVVRFLSYSRIEMRAGVGVRWMGDHGDVEAGFNFTIGLDIMPHKNMFLSLSADLGTLGEATVLHARSLVGARWRALSVHLGYDLFRVGRVNFHGPVAGIGLWF
jgi:hypothetical protein